jgi:hypothetical protein
VTLARDHHGIEAGGTQPRLRALDAEKAEQREEEASAGRQMRGRLTDQSIQQRPAVGAAVVGGGLRVVAVAAGRCRHLGRARADQIEAEPRHGRVAVAEPHVHHVGHAVPRGVVPRAGDRLGPNVGGDHARPRPRREYRGQARARADLEHALARPHAEMPAEEQRAGLGRLGAVADAEHAAAIVEEEQPLVVAHTRLRPAARR